LKVHLRKVDGQALLVPLLTEKPAAMVTLLADGRSCLVFPENVRAGLQLDNEALTTVRQALLQDRSTLLETDEGQAFAQVVNPPLRMIIVGAVHIAQALAPLATLVGYQVTVVDPRRAFATGERIPHAEISHEWPDEAIVRLAPDARTAIVTLTHDPKLDDPALELALKSPVYYIGALGSRRTHAKRLDRLRASGFTEQDLRRVRGPVGMDIGAKSPAEIALAILAEAVAAKYGKLSTPA